MRILTSIFIENNNKLFLNLNIHCCQNVTSNNEVWYKRISQVVTTFMF